MFPAGATHGIAASFEPHRSCLAVSSLHWLSNDFSSQKRVEGSIHNTMSSNSSRHSFIWQYVIDCVACIDHLQQILDPFYNHVGFPPQRLIKCYDRSALVVPGLIADIIESWTYASWIIWIKVYHWPEHNWWWLRMITFMDHLHESRPERPSHWKYWWYLPRKQKNKSLHQCTRVFNPLEWK